MKFLSIQTILERDEIKTAKIFDNDLSKKLIFKNSKSTFRNSKIIKQQISLLRVFSANYIPYKVKSNPTETVAVS